MPRKLTDERRARAPRPGADCGFTLIELLVVMIIIGILAGIAIPIFLSQRAKAHDSATKADVSNLGKEIATYFVEEHPPGTTLTLSTATPGRIDLTDGAFTTYARLTVGSSLAPGAGGSANLDNPTGWCVALTDPRGAVGTFKYTALDGLLPGACP